MSFWLRDGIEALLKVFIAEDLKVALLFQQLDLRFKNSILREMLMRPVEAPVSQHEHVCASLKKNIYCTVLQKFWGEVLKMNWCHHVFLINFLMFMLISSGGNHQGGVCLLLTSPSKAVKILVFSYQKIYGTISTPKMWCPNSPTFPSAASPVAMLDFLSQGSLSVAIMASKDQKLWSPRIPGKMCRINKSFGYVWLLRFSSAN